MYNTQQQALTNIAFVDSLVEGHVYDIHVTAVNEIGESLASNYLVVHAGVIPSKIRSLRWESSTTTSVTVRWQLPESNGGLQLSQFTLYYDIGQTGSFETIAITDTF